MKKFLIFSSFFGLASVILGALGSHSLKPTLINNGKLESFNIAIDYLLVHSILLIVVVILMKIFPNQKFVISGWLFISGLILFSVNIIFISLINFTSLSFLTPFGGLLLMAGWINIGIQGFRIKLN